MKITSVVCTYPPRIGGIGTAAARHAALLARAGHSVRVLAPPHGSPVGRRLDHGVVIERLRPVVTHRNSALVPQVAMRVRDADAVYLHYPFYGGAEAAALGARAARVPYVVFFHMDVQWEGWRGRALAAYDRTLAPAILRGAARVLVSSHDYAAHASIARLGLDLVERPYGVDTARFRPSDRAASRVALGVDPVRPMVLFVGGMDADHAFKGVPQLIDAFARADIADRAQLVLVGDGELREGFAARAARAGLGDAVRFLGRVDDATLVEAYRAADLTVLPSTTRAEAFGIVLAEAMACGSPVLASEWPGVRTVVDPSQGGRLVPAADVPALAGALREIMSDGDLRMRMGALARTAALERFSQAAEARQLDALFRSLR